MGKLSEEHQKKRNQNIDLAILSKGGISLYCNNEVLQYDVDLLNAKNYQILEFDGNHISSSMELHFALQSRLKLTSYGNCFDALDDFLHQYQVNENGDVLVFRDLNHLDVKSIQTLLDIFSSHIRSRIVIGEKLLVLIQVNDPKFKILKPIGSLNFKLWNDIEWFESDRF